MTEIRFAKFFPEYSQYFEILNRLVGLVQEESLKFNLTAIKDYEGIWNKHIIDSLMPTKSQLFNKFKPLTALDVGSGAGFPGLPLAIVMPEVQFTLIDSTRKKVDAINKFISELGIKNVEAKWQRLSPSVSTSGEYDLILARAVSYLPKLIELSSGYMSPEGMMVFYKSADQDEIDDGLETAKKMGLTLVGKHVYELPSENHDENKDAGSRNILFFRGVDTR